METKASETITENIFRSYYGADTFIEKSAIPKEFGFESKKGSGKDGYPDFFLDNEDFVIIVEAKTSKQKDAENDVLFYMEHNKIDKDMLGIAVSGQTLEDLQVSYFNFLFLSVMNKKSPCFSWGMNCFFFLTNNIGYIIF